MGARGAQGPSAGGWWAPGGCRGHLQADGMRGLGGELEEPAGAICELFADLGLQGERFV